MAVWGLDVNEVKQLATQLKGKGNDIQDILTQLTNKLSNTSWTGPDAERFRNEWSTTHTASLKKVITALHDAGEKAQTNANAQEQTSQA